MSLFLPFNFKPDSTIVRTGEYTIPSGKYAFVYDNSNTLNIDNRRVGFSDSVSEVYSTTSNSIISNQTLYTATTDINLTITISILASNNSDGSLTLYTDVLDSIVPFQFSFPQSSSNILTQNYAYNSFGNKTEKLFSFKLQKGASLYMTVSSARSTTDIKLYEECINQSAQVWTPVPEGTVLNGQNYTVVEYVIP